jgi:hypothetical protein
MAIDGIASAKAGIKPVEDTLMSAVRSIDSSNALRTLASSKSDAPRVCGRERGSSRNAFRRSVAEAAFAASARAKEPKIRRVIITCIAISPAFREAAGKLCASRAGRVSRQCFQNETG